jgi:methionyl-tRNA synthetase
MQRFYVTSPIFYPNAQPHLGHAYTVLLCDVLARHHKLLGDDTYFLTGTDENSEKIIQAAEKAGEEPRVYLDSVVQRFKDLYELIDIEYDQFIRTSDEAVHWPGAIAMWERLVEAGALYKSSYTGLYCVGHEAFLTEKDLDERGFCPDHGTAPEKITEENWFFKLSEYASRVEAAIVDGTLPVLPETRRNEILSFLRSGVEDVSFSRPSAKMTWGIPVPGDETQKMYVWIDALTNYISALGFGRGEELMHFWPGTHVMGKDILRFHALFWPAMLMAANLPLPKELFVHGTIISDGKKMSKTLGNVISPYELVERYGKDAARYLLLRHVNATEDTDITLERLDEWYTADLVNGLGNLVARVMQMATTNLSESVEMTQETQPDVLVDEHLVRFDFNRALDGIWERIGHDDALIALKKPFSGIKSENPEEQEEAILIIKKLVRELNAIATEIEPFMPATSKIIKKAVSNHMKPENLFPRLS